MKKIVLKTRDKKTPRKAKKVLLTFCLFVLFLPCFSFARDFLSSIENASGQIRQIATVAGVIALMISGVCFYWSKRLGMEKLSAALIGTVVFAAASTIFTVFYDTFN